MVTPPRRCGTAGSDGSAGARGLAAAHRERATRGGSAAMGAASWPPIRWLTWHSLCVLRDSVLLIRRLLRRDLRQPAARARVAVHDAADGTKAPPAKIDAARHAVVAAPDLAQRRWQRL